MHFFITFIRFNSYFLILFLNFLRHGIKNYKAFSLSAKVGKQPFILIFKSTHQLGSNPLLVEESSKMFLNSLFFLHDAWHVQFMVIFAAHHAFPSEMQSLPTLLRMGSVDLYNRQNIMEQLWPTTWYSTTDVQEASCTIFKIAWKLTKWNAPKFW